MYDLAGNEAKASIDVFVGTVRLGGMALNTVHARNVIDDIIAKAIERTDLGQKPGGAENLLKNLRDNPDPAHYQAIVAVIEPIFGKGSVPKQFLSADVPIIFGNDENLAYENLDLENFGNAITAYPGDNGILNSEKPGVGRVVNGDKLDLYLVAPREGVHSATFRLNGVTRDAMEVMPGETLPHTFQLEEEQALQLLPGDADYGWWRQRVQFRHAHVPLRTIAGRVP